MSYFDTFFSNTAVSTNNQKFYTADPREIQTARAYIKVTVGGEYAYSFLYANQIASTFDDGSESFAGYLCDAWEILSLKLSVCKEEFTPDGFIPLTFDGNEGRRVGVGEVFSTDPVRIRAERGQRLCLEMVYRGREIPYLHETLVKGERLMAGAWVEHLHLPRPVAVGCDRPVRRRLVIWGDSISEGLGTPLEGYAGYAQVLTEQLDNDIAVWNIALGYGRAADAASGSLWFWEAKQADAVLLCFGVNDILRGYSAAEIQRNLSLILSRLRRAGCRIGIQTVPPFDFRGEHFTVWQQVNAYIQEVLAPTVDFFFDNRPILVGEDGYSCPYGGHPNTEGARLWGMALAERLGQSDLLK